MEIGVLNPEAEGVVRMFGSMIDSFEEKHGLFEAYGSIGCPN